VWHTISSLPLLRLDVLKVAEEGTAGEEEGSVEDCREDERGEGGVEELLELAETRLEWPEWPEWPPCSLPEVA